MTQPIEERYLAHLACLEWVVVTFYRAHPELADATVDSVYEELSRRYRAEATAHTHKPGRLEGLRAELHAALLPEAEALAGRGRSTLSADLMAALQRQHGEPHPVSAEELQLMLNRLRKSIRRFGKLGRRGYLETVEPYLPE